MANKPCTGPLAQTHSSPPPRAMTTMAPPFSPKDQDQPRRSSRRSHTTSPIEENVPSASTAPPSSKRRSKSDNMDPDEGAGGYSNGNTSGGTNGTSSRQSRRSNKNGRSNGKGMHEEPPAASPPVPQEVEEEDEEEQGVTRCVCEKIETEGGEVMIQCDQCRTWQHLRCIGLEGVDVDAVVDYFCEWCRPEFNRELVKKLAGGQRQSSSHQQHDKTGIHSAQSTSRTSRSHSPNQNSNSGTFAMPKQPAKRRNTMNSRDAAFDESLKEIMEATAAEAEAAASHVVGDDDKEGTDNKKKRKRAEDDVPVKKRTRSSSVMSDHQAWLPPNASREEVPKVAPAPPVKANNSRNRRGGSNRKAATEVAPALDGEEVMPPPPKRSHQRKSGAHSKRLPPAYAHGGLALDRRNHSGSDQPLFTSWYLPDYLLHLERVLPDPVPRPLNVRGSDGEMLSERGVRVRWPAKRTSVGDMNKRVRALVEWVGREQAGAMERGRRREALERVLLHQQAELGATGVDGVSGTLPGDLGVGDGRWQASAAGTMTMMEELMKELIGFQERFGPGATLGKARDSYRRTMV